MVELSPQRSTHTSARVANARKKGVASTEIITRIGCDDAICFHLSKLNFLFLLVWKHIDVTA